MKRVEDFRWIQMAWRSGVARGGARSGRRKTKLRGGGPPAKTDTNRRKKTLCSSSSAVLKPLLQDFLSSTSIHGAAHLVAKDRHPVELFVWIVTITLAGAGAMAVSLSTWNRFNSSPTVISVERDRWAWNTSFPAATVCPQPGDKGSRQGILEDKDIEALAKEMTMKHLNDSSAQGRVGVVMAFLKAFRIASLGSLSPLRPFVSEESVLPQAATLHGLYLRLQPNFTFGTSSSAFDVPPAVPVLAETGLCYSIFSDIGAVEASKGLGRSGGDPSGNPLDGDPNVQLIQMSHGYRVYFHSPGDKADVASQSLESPAGHYASVQLAATSIITTVDAKEGLQVDQRKCRFQEEILRDSDVVYSYNLCRSRCRARLALQLCACAPHLFENTEGAKPCGIKGLACISQYEDLLIKLREPSSGDQVPCNCLPMCEDVNYASVDQRVITWPFGSSLKWGITKYPRTRYKRDVLFGFSDLLGSMGGTAGLFLGCSLLSGVEILYFATLRVFWIFFQRNRWPTGHPA